MEKTKQNKQRGNFTPAGAGLGQTSQGGRDGARKSNGERGRTQKRATERVKAKINDNYRGCFQSFSKQSRISECLVKCLSCVLTDLTTDHHILFPIALTFDLSDFPSWSKSNMNEGSSSISAKWCM